MLLVLCPMRSPQKLQCIVSNQWPQKWASLKAVGHKTKICDCEKKKLVGWKERKAGWELRLQNVHSSLGPYAPDSEEKTWAHLAPCGTGGSLWALLW